jgi:hypothetical protein
MPKGLGDDNGCKQSVRKSVAYECGVGRSTSDCVILINMI